MAIITLSRQFGAGGRTLGRMIAKKLDYLYLDEVIIEKIAEKEAVQKIPGKFGKRAANPLSRTRIQVSTDTDLS